jgi:hypothetical protein
VGETTRRTSRIARSYVNYVATMVASWPPKCVGEAYGVTRSYTNCYSEGGKIGDIFSLYFTLNLCSKLEENKQRFVIHWNKEHARFQSPSAYLTLVRSNLT